MSKRLACLVLPLVAIAAPASAQSLIPGAGWSGPYFGLTGGGALADLKSASKSSDLVWSGHAGYGLSFAGLYVGAEVDGTWGGARSSYDISPLYSSTVEVDWSATARARLGVTAGPALLYVTGGAAWSGRTLGIHTLGAQVTTGSERAMGTVIGAGIEMKVLPNVSARLEGLRYDFSSPSLTSFAQVPAALGGSAMKGGDETVIRAGITLRFN